MATTNNTQNEIINAWQNLIEKSVKANTTFLQESAKIFTDILSKKIETKDLLKINTEVLNAAANNLIKLNIANTENLVNFGITLSKGLFSVNSKKNTSNTKPEAETVTTTERNQINLVAKQGEALSTSFYLNSHNAFSQSGKFYYENFVNELSGERTNLSMNILPKEFILEPGKSLKVDISLTVHKDVQPGKYLSTVKLDGMDKQEFDIVVEILENKEQFKAVAPPTKKSGAKNSLDKETVSKKAAVKRRSKK